MTHRHQWIFSLGNPLKVFNNNPANLEELKARIREKIQAFPEKLISRSRLRQCQNKGTHMNDMIFQEIKCQVVYFQSQ